jgi:TetR/AcrR family transcriptional regulator
MVQKRKKMLDEDRSTRDLILDIAELEIAKQGVEGFRLKNIAEQVGIQLPSLYAHFSGRKELFEALADRLMDDLLQIYESIRNLPPKDALISSADRTIDFYLEKRGYARMLLGDFPAPYEHSNFNRCDVKVRKVLSIIGEIIDRGVEEKTVRPIHPDVFLSFRMGVTLFPLFMRSDSDKKEMVTDPELIRHIKAEANRVLLHFIAP